MDNEKLSQFSDDSIDVELDVVSGNELNKAKGESEAAEQVYDSNNITDEHSRESEAALMDSVIVNNEKVRYYYNKTLCLREPIGNILDMLEGLHSSTFVYLSQHPENGDYSVISTLFELIPAVSVMIDWDNLNHSCYWEDFCRETKQLMYLLDKVNDAALKCCDTATDLLQRAQELFQGITENAAKHPAAMDRSVTFRKETDYIYDSTCGQSIQINWKKPGDEIELMWHDADGGLLNVALKQTGTGFRLRFLRHIIYHARGLLEGTYLMFMKLNVALHLHIPIEKLEKCKDVQLKQLTHQEHCCLAKAKREFDFSLDLIGQLISRFKFQAFHLLEYSPTFKGMRKASRFTLKRVPNFTVLKMSINDSLLMRVMSSGIQAQANEESFDFTVFPDRTEDIVAKIEDLLTVDNSNYRRLEMLLNIVRIILPTENYNFTAKERASIDDEKAAIVMHRFQVRRYLKKALRLLETHPAFCKMDQVKLANVRMPTNFFSRSTKDIEAIESPGGSETQLVDSTVMTRDENNNETLVEDEKVWISVEGGVKVTADNSRGILTKCLSDNSTINSYSDLTSDERVILCIRVVRQLLVSIANEQCFAKISSGRVFETKSLAKRLKIKDRQNLDMQKIILEQSKYLQQMLKLTKAMRILK